MFIEEPTPPEDPGALREVAARSVTRIASGERLASVYEVRPFLESRSLAILQVDLANCGGITSGKKIAALAESHYVSMCPHNPNGPLATAAAVHLLAAIPNCFMLEMIGSPDDLALHSQMAPGALQPRRGLSSFADRTGARSRARGGLRGSLSVPAVRRLAIAAVLLLSHMTLDTRRGERLRIRAMTFGFVGCQFAVAMTTVDALLQAPRVNFLKVPVTRPRLRQQIIHVVTTRATLCCGRPIFHPRVHLRAYRPRGDSSRHDTRPEERAFERRLAVDAGQSCQFTNGIQAWNRLLVSIEHATTQIDRDAAHALTSQRIRLHRVEGRGRDFRRHLASPRVLFGKASKVGVFAAIDHAVVAAHGFHKPRRRQTCLVGQFLRRRSGLHQIRVLENGFLDVAKVGPIGAGDDELRLAGLVEHEPERGLFLPRVASASPPWPSSAGSRNAGPGH